MQWLAELCVRRPVFASVLILSLVVVGAFAFGQLGVDRLPKVDFPTVTVTTRLPGAAPEQVESEVTDKVEEAVNTISGIDQLSSNSAEGISQVVVTFRLEKNADVAAQEVRDRINRILPLLPRTITAADDRETGSRRGADPDDRGHGEEADPRRHRVHRQGPAPPPRERRRRRPGARARRPQAADQRLGRCRSAAGLQPDRQRRLAHAAVAERRHPRRPHRRRRAVDHDAHARPRRAPEEFGDLVLRQVDGHPVQVKDVARVDDGVAEATTLASINGDPTVLLQVRKQSGTNTVEVVNNVKERLDDVRAGAAVPATSCASCAMGRNSSRRRSAASKST